MSKAESAELILKLYDLRREATMRKARDWMFFFNPTTAEEYMATMMDQEHGAYVRMVVSYWDMAAALVVEGAIDAEMFRKTNGEHIMVFAKIEPILSDLRTMWQNPEALASLEKVIMDQPNGAEQVKQTQEWLKTVQAQIAAAQAG
ncbi:MAG TPA: hypothetical protein PKA82_17495 [Pyrinomonadaceae bacterium]|nr:hypothetical protein [Pyrinomonadaceae bacterium]